jgi:16S rRNA processing protein RimM
LTEHVVVGRVGKPHGIGGAFVVEHPSDDAARFAVGAELVAGDAAVRVEESKRSGGRLVVKLDRPVARGTELRVPSSSLPPPEPDSFYVFQLVGLDVVEEDGRALGKVKDVANYAANDVLELDSGTLLPLVEACVQVIDLEGRRIVVSRGFADPE